MNDILNTKKLMSIFLIHCTGMNCIFYNFHTRGLIVYEILSYVNSYMFVSEQKIFYNKDNKLHVLWNAILTGKIIVHQQTARSRWSRMEGQIQIIATQLPEWNLPFSTVYSTSCPIYHEI